MDKPANEARAFTKRDSSSDDPVASFAKDYTSGMYDGCGSTAFDAVLKAEAEARFQAIHEEEISAGVAKFTSFAKIYTQLITEDSTGRAIYKASRDAALGALKTPVGLPGAYFGVA